MQRERIKTLIELASDVKEADEIIETETGYTDVKEKMAFLTGMFDFILIGRLRVSGIEESKSELMDYYSVLNAIINEKWEG